MKKLNQEQILIVSGGCLKCLCTDGGMYNLLAFKDDPAIPYVSDKGACSSICCTGNDGGYFTYEPSLRRKRITSRDLEYDSCPNSVFSKRVSFQHYMRNIPQTTI